MKVTLTTIAIKQLLKGKEWMDVRMDLYVENTKYFVVAYEYVLRICSYKGIRDLWRPSFFVDLVDLSDSKQENLPPSMYLTMVQFRK